MRRPILLTAFSALLFVLSFPPYGVWPLAFVCLVPWLIALRDLPSRRAAFFSGIGLSVGITVGGYFWVGTTLEHFGGLPAPVAMLGCVLFGLFNQIQFAVWGAFAWRSERSLWKQIVVYCALDWVIPKLFMDTLGLTFVNALPLAQWAEHVGMYGLTVLIFWGNLTIARGWKSRQTLTWGTLTVVLWAVGFWRMTSIETQIGAGPFLKAGVIQANIGDFEKVASENRLGDAANIVVQKYVAMSAELAQNTPDLDALLWPETAYPSTFLKPFTVDEQKRDAWVIELSQRWKIPVWLGGYDRDGSRDFNSVFFLEPDFEQGKGFPPAYHKTVLLPFAEFIPFSESIAWVRRMFPQVGFFGRGNGPEAFRLKTKSGREVRGVPLICYEALFGWFSRAGRKAGGEVLLNFTNDSWFGPWGEPQLHLALSQMRSIESRLPQLRATNTGISTLISPTGALVSPGPIGVAESLVFSAPLTPVTGGLYLLLGEWWGWLALLTAVTLFLCSSGTSRWGLRPKKSHPKLR